jgi:hypothetical protein
MIRLRIIVPPHFDLEKTSPTQRRTTLITNSTVPKAFYRVRLEVGAANRMIISSVLFPFTYLTYGTMTSTGVMNLLSKHLRRNERHSFRRYMETLAVFFWIYPYYQPFWDRAVFVHDDTLQCDIAAYVDIRQ